MSPCEILIIMLIWGKYVDKQLAYIDMSQKHMLQVTYNHITCLH